MSQFICGHCFIDFGTKTDLIEHHHKVVRRREQRAAAYRRKKYAQSHS